MQLLSRRRELRWVDVLSCSRYDIMPTEFSLSRRPFLQLVRYNALFYLAFRFFSFFSFLRIIPLWKNRYLYAIFLNSAGHEFSQISKYKERKEMMALWSCFSHRPKWPRECSLAFFLKLNWPADRQTILHRASIAPSLSMSQKGTQIPACKCARSA